MTNKRSGRVLLALLWTGAGVTAWAQSSPQLTTLYSFTGGDDGKNPYNSVTVGKGGTLYGTTESGGTIENGVVFGLKPPAAPGESWTEEVLYNFDGPTGDFPSGPLVVGANGVLFGAAQGQADVDLRPGLTNNGAAYSLTPPSGPGQPWEYTALYNFEAGQGPTEIIMGAGGVLYGAAAIGPSDYSGSVFSLTPPASAGGAWGEATLYAFPAVDGAYLGPVAMGSGGVFYGAAWAPGGSTVFSLTPPASSGGDWTVTVLSQLDQPLSGLTIGSGGTLYGTTLLGGASTACFGLSCGTVFAVAPPASPGGAWTKKLLHSFHNGDGAYPSQGVLVGPGGVLYGAAQSGGEFGFGALYSLTPPASPHGSWTETLLYSFTGGSDGSAPNGLAFGPGGVLYGTTINGGNTAGCAGGCGTVFAFRP